MLINYNHMAEELKLLEQQINLLQIQLNAFPPGKLCIVKGKKYPRYYQSDGHSSDYIPAKQKQLVNDLAVKKYLILKSEFLTKEHAILKSCINQHLNNPDHSQTLLQSPEHKKLLSTYLQDTLSSEEKWMNASFEKNTNYPEHLRFPSPSGNILRSKSEYMIDSALYTAKIPFRYECKLVLNEITFYPDFTLLHPRKKNIVYWEHFGLMDVMSYSDAALRKLQIYLSNDIIPNINLLSTFETKNQPLTYAQIEQVIQFFLSS